MPSARGAIAHRLTVEPRTSSMSRPITTSNAITLPSMRSIRIRTGRPSLSPTSIVVASPPSPRVVTVWTSPSARDRPALAAAM